MKRDESKISAKMNVDLKIHKIKSRDVRDIDFCCPVGFGNP